MARRFGGKYSPGSKRVPDLPLRVHPAGARVNLLFVVPFIFAIRAFLQDPAGLVLNLGVFALLMLAAWLTREGVLAQHAYDAREAARRPAFPRKIAGSVLTGVALGLASLGAGPGAAVLLGALGAVLHLGAFGPDPLRDKGMDGVDGFQTDRALRATAEAEKHLKDMAEAIRRSGDRALVDRVASFSANARALFRAVEDDPRRLSAARRYLGVYLTGARDATAKFADLYARTRDDTARREYAALLDDMEGRFALRRETLLGDDRQALDIEMEVLRERLAREGLRTDAAARQTT
ncbi:5-bromo-4-chloroindolyl phosphate hydrolysis family protein [Rhodobacteraceae bacterium 2376]|uniref:5-bromo-4-chloroindolyl phosphate hydrolysis family protein n=1 Tax=Rhabdonatronobacter sediminivivens TaxID=2743469 RepID=A0A7Z0KYQ0_9RHOB|nr:5-bromo-4-chloroindolyl phosphate hydrolysis family protein [Rhabdonatronobacter sediminivivens]NYS25564.1 5-bromo-4-chloroindolyl phosphate hydrolysis family protein [Rhabdonatronobacter sediminivivens]